MNGNACRHDFYLCFACLHNLEINYFVVSLGHTNNVTIIYLCFSDFVEKLKLDFKMW
jgi:hypothetical protein